MKEYLTDKIAEITCYALCNIEPDEIRVIEERGKFTGVAVYYDVNSLPEKESFMVVNKATGEEFPLLPIRFSEKACFIPLMNHIKHEKIFKKVDEVRDGKE